MKHTPTPWNHDGRDFIKANDQSIAICFGDTPSSVPEEEMKANAAFIVRACNAHDELVKALAELLAQAKQWRQDRPVTLHSAINHADRVLAFASGGNFDGIAKAEGK